MSVLSSGIRGALASASSKQSGSELNGHPRSPETPRSSASCATHRVAAATLMGKQRPRGFYFRRYCTHLVFSPQAECWSFVFRLSMKQDEPLTAVRLVCSGHPLVAALPHATHLVDAFLLGDGTQWTLESASQRGFVGLLDRLRKLEWPGFNHHFRDGRLNQAVRSAVKNGYDVQVVQWWLRCYMPGQTLCSMALVFELAIQYAQLPVLEWLHQETQGRLPELPDLVRCFNPQVIYWLHDHRDRGMPVRLRMLCPPEAGCEFIKWCIKHGDACKEYFDRPAEAFACAAQSDLETMQQLLEYWPELCTPDSLDLMVLQGNFETAKWLHGSRPQTISRTYGRLQPAATSIIDSVWKKLDGLCLRSYGKAKPSDSPGLTASSGTLCVLVTWLYWRPSPISARRLRLRVEMSQIAKNRGILKSELI